jgi:hypothetical protein
VATLPPIVARLRVCGPPTQGRAHPSHELRRRELRERDRGPDAKVVVGLLDALQLGHGRDVEERGAGRGIAGRARDHVGAARDRAQLARALDQDLERLLERAGTEVAGRGGLGGDARRRRRPRARGLDHGREDLLIPGAAAEVPGQGAADVVELGRRRGLREEGLRAQDHSRHARAALDGALGDEGLLQRMERVPGGEAFDRLHRRPVRLVREHEAGVHGLAVHEHGARAALAAAAALARPREPERVAEEVEEPMVGPDAQRVPLAVDRQRDVDLVGHRAVRSGPGP